MEIFRKRRREAEAPAWSYSYDDQMDAHAATVEHDELIGHKTAPPALQIAVRGVVTTLYRRLLSDAQVERVEVQKIALVSGVATKFVVAVTFALHGDAGLHPTALGGPVAFNAPVLTDIRVESVVPSEAKHICTVHLYVLLAAMEK